MIAWTAGRIPGACHDASDVFEPGQAVVRVRTGIAQGTRGIVVAAYQNRVRVRLLDGNWAGATEVYWWADWAPVACPSCEGGVLAGRHGGAVVPAWIICSSCHTSFKVPQIEWCFDCQDRPAEVVVAVEMNFPAGEDGPERDMPVERHACRGCAVGHEVVR